MVRCWTDTNIQRPIGVIHAASNDAAVMDEHASNWSLIDGKCVFCLKRLVSHDAVEELLYHHQRLSHESKMVAIC